MLRTDDELGAVSNEFLGPSGYTFPFRARYSAYGVGIALAITVTAAARRVGVPLNLFTIAWGVVLVVLVTRAVGRAVTYEMPLRAAAVVVWHEVTAPRPAVAVGDVLRPGRVHVKDDTGRPVCTGCGSRRHG